MEAGQAVSMFPGAFDGGDIFSGVTFTSIYLTDRKFLSS